MRRGDSIGAFSSADGLNWEWIGTESITLPSEIYVGLAVNSHDNSRLGTAVFDQVRVNAVPPLRRRQTTEGSGDGLQAAYFDGATGKIVSRIDPMVNFDWDIDPPAEGIGADHFSARWEGWLEVPADDLYALHLISDDGARLWLDRQLAIDAWADLAASQSTAKVALKAGQRYALKLEYFERAGEAIAKLLWSTPTIPKQPIPQSQLYTTENPPRTTGPVRIAAPGSSEPSAAEVPTDLPSLEARLDDSARAFLAARVTGLVQVVELPGRTTAARLGRWETEGQSIFAIDRRGYLEYEFVAPAADIYQLEIQGDSHEKLDLDRSFQLLISADGERLGRKLLDAGFDKPGTVQVLTPWLKAGPHRIGIYWDNARKGRSFQVVAVRLQTLSGPDADQDGRKDWVENWLERSCGVDTTQGNFPVIYSPSSPACLEGRGRFLSMMRITSPNGALLKAQPAREDRWYSDVPLSPDMPTEIELSYENGGHREKRTLAWEPTNLLVAGDMTVRVGDALLLHCLPEGTAAAPNGAGVAGIQVAGLLVHTADALKPFVHGFGQAGTFEVKGTYTGVQGRTVSNTIHVKVVAGSLGDPVAAWVGRPRVWDSPNLPSSGVVLDADPRLKLTPAASPDPDKQRFALLVDEAEPRYIAARAGQGGPILSAVRVDGFRLFSSSETNFEVVDTYDDGTQLIEMGLVLSSALPEVAVEVKLIVGGVVFEDGTVIKRLAAVDFNPLGETLVRFLRPALAKTSTCHRTAAWQGAVRLGEYR